MADSTLILKVKTALRITTSVFDDEEIAPMIDACRLDLEGAGVEMDSADQAALIEQAIIFYCKAYFGSNPDRDSWAKHYERARDSLASRATRRAKDG